MFTKFEGLNGLLAPTTRLITVSFSKQLCWENSRDHDLPYDIQNTKQLKFILWEAKPGGHFNNYMGHFFSGVLSVGRYQLVRDLTVACKVSHMEVLSVM